MKTMKFMGIIPIFLLILGAFTRSGTCADSIEVFIKGFAFDTNGSPVKNATVSLQKVGLSALTDSLGACTIYKKIPGDIPVLRPALQPSHFVNPILRPDGLYFSVAGPAEQATVGFFSFSGRKIKDIVKANLVPGNYKITLSRIASSQPYVLRAQIGCRVFVFKVSLCGIRPAVGSASVARLDNNSMTKALSKRASFQDNITVAAAGYDSMSRPLDSTDGAHYFYLRRTGSTVGKRLDITFTLNYVKNPFPSYLTAVWLENSSKVRLQTMFVSKWLSVEGYRRVGICPDLLGPDSTYWATQRTTNAPFVDAVTHATPIQGKNSINTILNGYQNPVRCCIETHVDGETNIMYSASLNPQVDSSFAPGAVTYVPSRRIDIDALDKVTFRLHK
jgi:hypothetical protein